MPLTSKNSTNKSLFRVGCVVTTPGALRLFESTTLTVMDFVLKHQSGDWGDLCESDIRANHSAITHHERVLSRYSIGLEVERRDIYVITEWDRSFTTVLLVEEY